MKHYYTKRDYLIVCNSPRMRRKQASKGWTPSQALAQAPVHFHIQYILTARHVLCFSLRTPLFSGQQNQLDVRWAAMYRRAFPEKICAASSCSAHWLPVTRLPPSPPRRRLLKHARVVDVHTSCHRHTCNAEGKSTSVSGPCSAQQTQLGQQGVCMGWDKNGMRVRQKDFHFLLSFVMALVYKNCVLSSQYSKLTPRTYTCNLTNDVRVNAHSEPRSSSSPPKPCIFFEKRKEKRSTEQANVKQSKRTRINKHLAHLTNQHV